MGQHLLSVQLTATGINITDSNKVMFASTFLQSTAAIWWYTQVQASVAPTNCNASKSAAKAEFIMFYDGLKHEIRFKVLKGNGKSPKDATNIALQVDSSI